MARGHDDSSNGEDGPILSPDELDIADDEHVAEIDDGRYVVSPNGPIGDVPRNATDEGADPVSETPSSEPGDPARPPEVTETDVRDWLSEQFTETDSRYGFDVTATFDGSVEHRRMMSNDVVTIFESLVLWYAQQIDGTTPVEEVLGILLMEANVPVRYPSAGLQQVLESTDLGPEDSIADLAEAIDADDGFRI